jgi:hypothetical protein
LPDDVRAGDAHRVELEARVDALANPRIVRSVGTFRDV